MVRGDTGGVSRDLVWFYGSSIIQITGCQIAPCLTYTFDADRATGRWYFEVPTTNAVTKKAQWMAGRYIEEYVRVCGGRALLGS